jgi:hypothetical protein
MKRSRTKRSKEVHTEPLTVEALRFTKAGLLLLMDGNDYSTELEFPEPLTMGEMLDEFSRSIPRTALLMGFVAFTAGNDAINSVMPGLDEADAKIISDWLEEKFLPANCKGFRVVEDPRLGPCIEVPMDELDEPNTGLVN